jgi:hypothetical protein
MKRDGELKRDFRLASRWFALLGAFAYLVIVPEVAPLRVGE